MKIKKNHGSDNMSEEKKLALSGAEGQVPQLRFPEFKADGDWTVDNFGNITKINQGLQIPISERFTEKVEQSYFYITNEFLKANSEKRYFIKNPPKSVLCNKEEVLMTRTGNTGQVVTNVEGAFHNNFFKIDFDRKKLDKDFLVYYLRLSHTQRKILDYAGASTIPDLNHSDFYRLLITLPKNPKEQQKIANCLSSLDNVITAETEKLDLLQDHKKGLLQQLFPNSLNHDSKRLKDDLDFQNSKKSSHQANPKNQGADNIPQFRFPEFKDDGDWEETTLDKCLDYLQPTPYLVSNTDYDNKYETPVLTAGKTFILGYTDEKVGIFNNNLPVIIFDDFTTASKFVDFPFKAKSSAMKILLAKGDNDIKFMFEAIQNLKFEVKTHKRHWISVYSKLNILKPTNPKEQQKIANCLSAADELIATQTKKIEQLQEHKKGLLQQLFPTIND